MNFTFILPLLLIGCSLAVGQSVVYETDFEEFTTGEGNWMSNKWVGNDLNSVGIDDNIVPGLGKTAYMGFTEPQTTKTVMLRPLPISPQKEGINEISFRTLMGIQDSSNQRRDAFCFTVYNALGKVLACIRFDNRNDSYGIWRFDGTAIANTDTAFLRGQLYDLRFTISYADNTWSALLDGLPLFTDQPFHTGGETLDFRGVAAEWIVTGGSPDQFGNNWLLVADWQVSTSTPLKDSLVFVQPPPRALAPPAAAPAPPAAAPAPVALKGQAQALRTASNATVAHDDGEKHDDDDDDDQGKDDDDADAIETPKLRWAARTDGRYYVETTQNLRSLQPWTVSGDSGWVKAGHRFELNLDIPEETQGFYRIRRSSVKEEVEP